MGRQSGHRHGTWGLLIDFHLFVVETTSHIAAFYGYCVDDTVSSVDGH